jgi:epoxyqueuosine reductase QueG
MKQKIRSHALDMGVDAVGFAAAADYKSPQSPGLGTIFPAVKSLVVLAYREASHCESDNMRIAMGGRLGLRDFMKSSTYRITRFLERECGARAMMISDSYPLNYSPESKFGLIADFSHRHAAVAAGLGDWGRHNLVIHPTLGARVLFTTILTDIELPSDPPVTEELCNRCNLCVEQCAGGALSVEGKTDEMKCLAHSQPSGLGANIRFWRTLLDSSADERKKMLTSPEYMRLYQASYIGLQYHCFKCYSVCPVGR